MGILDVMFFLCMFVLLQLAAGLTGLLGAGLIWEVLLAYVMVVVVFVALRWSELDVTRIGKHTGKAMILTTLLGLALIIPTSWFADVTGMEMPESQAQTMLHLLSHPLGAVAVVLLAPLSEEIVFRGAILKTLLSIIPISRNRYWISIAISALCFGIAHGNMAQGTHAFMMGILMGWLFFSTKSIWLCMIIHFVNNLAAYLFCTLSGNPEITVEEVFGGNSILMYSSLVLSLVIAAGCIYKLATSKLTK